MCSDPSIGPIAIRIVLVNACSDTAYASLQEIVWTPGPTIEDLEDDEPVNVAAAVPAVAPPTVQWVRRRLSGKKPAFKEYRPLIER